MTPFKKRFQEAMEAAAEKHGREYFKRNDLPGPGSTHDQIYSGGWNECLKFLMQSSEWAEVREALEKNGLQCKNAGLYGPMNISPGECECSSCSTKKALATIRAMEGNGE